MSCPTPSGLQAYLDGVARGDDKDAIRTHLEACVDCRALVLALAPDIEHSITEQHDPGMRAEAQLTLGKALWDARRDRRRAVALVREARGPLGAHPLSQKLADDWLATHAGN